MNTSIYWMVKPFADAVRNYECDAVMQESARLVLDLLAHKANGGDSLLDELNAAFDLDERLEQTDGRAELAAAVADLQSGEEQTAEGWLWPEKRKRVLGQLVTGMSKRMFVLADEYARIVGCAVTSGWASDYATETTRAELWLSAVSKGDEPLIMALENRWPPLELVEQREDSVLVRDWRVDELWQYTGVATIDELNRQLQVGGWHEGYTIEDDGWTEEEMRDWQRVK